MIDKEMAEEYASSSTSDRGYYYEGLKEGFLDGLKAGRPKWHKVADGDLPKENAELKAQIEKMKCCENCAWWYKLPNGQRDCAETCENRDNWSLRR